MMLINMLDIAQQLELVNQEAHFDIENNTFDLIQGNETDAEPDEYIMENLTFKELAMYATGLAANQDLQTLDNLENQK
jgi:hypothetical protein